MFVTSSSSSTVLANTDQGNTFFWQFQDSVQNECASQRSQSSVLVKGALSLTDRILLNSGVSRSHHCILLNYMFPISCTKRQGKNHQVILYTFNLLIINSFIFDKTKSI